MRRRLSKYTSRKLAVLFFGVFAPPSLALAWLGVQLLDQDRYLWEQRELEGRQVAAEVAVRSLEKLLVEARQLEEADLPEGIVRFSLSRDGLDARPKGRLLWFPVVTGLREAGNDRFREAERLEFRGATGEALRTYRQMARLNGGAVRVGALLRLARVYRRLQRRDDALAVYRELSGIDPILIDGMPSDLLALRATCFLLEESDKEQELAAEAASLKRDLLRGRWILDRPTWELTARQLKQWTGVPLTAPPEGKAFSEAAEWLWAEWRLRTGSLSKKTGGSVIEEVTVIWPEPDTAGPLTVISPGVLRKWIDSLARTDFGTEHRLSLMALTGQILAGSQPGPGTPVVRRLPSETGLPWTLVVSPGDSPSRAPEFAYRRQLLSMGLLAIVLLLAGGSYFLWRVMRQELAVSRLQTEFVSAVSHEFRTPLASLQHVTELLQEDDELPPERRRLFYEVLERNTERLHRLVESLLDFARMEGKRKPYELGPLDAAEFVSRVVNDFHKEVEPRGYRVDLQMESPGPLLLKADAGSLSNALWNLLDNAVKYSPEGSTIDVSVGPHPAGLAIEVRDHGLGIPAVEREVIFRRFVRGRNAIALGIQGTGLGLAMVSHIVKAHGGTMELQSTEGVGSTFRLVLPREGQP